MDSEGLSLRPMVCTITLCHGRPTEVERLLDSLVEAVRQVGEDADVHVYLIDSTPLNSREAEGIERACRTHGAEYLRGPESVRAKRNQSVAQAIERGFGWRSSAGQAPAARRPRLFPG
jgi:hypothetical protein